MTTKPTGARKVLRMVNRLGISSLFLGLAAALLKAWVTYYLGPGQAGANIGGNMPGAPPPVQAAGPQTVEDLLQASPISLARWQEMVERFDTTDTEQERQFRPYLGKEVVWEGFYDQSNLVENPRDEAHGCVLILHESRGTLFREQLLGPPMVRCWLPAGEAERLKRFSRGDWVVVRGRLNDGMLAGSKLGTDLDGCEVILNSPIRSVETAYTPLSEAKVMR